MKLTYKDWSLEYVVEWDTLFVLSIFVEERRQGTATQLMNMLLEKAREEEVNVIQLPAMSFDPEEWMETEELKNRCERMWFETVERYSIGENKWYAMRMEL
jgi:GNAT superfamily N-acetyltransferase